MVFKFATFDPAQDPDDFNPAFPPTPSSSPSMTLCQPCEYTWTFTKTIVRRLAAGASIVLTAPAFEPHDDEIPERYAETLFHSINLDVPSEIHERQLKEFTLKELQVATRNFSNKKIIGSGGFGDVYMGQLPDGSVVAIKRRRKESAQSIFEFEREVMLGSVIFPRHNVLPLLGFFRTIECMDLLLVYPLMINKSVDTHPQLDWSIRRKIAMGAARGLLELHDLNFVHRDIKPSNILLDEEFEPYIGDFGLAKYTPRRLRRNESEAGSHIEESYFTNRICGTHGYRAPEYAMEGIYSLKTDVFAFGVVLLQLVTGQKTSVFAGHENQQSMSLPDWVKGLLEERRLETLVDPNLQGEYDEEEMEKVMKLGLLCTRTVSRERPYMAQVVKILEGLSIEERWEEYRYAEEFLNPLCSSHYQSEDVFSTVVSPEELSGPR